MRFRQPVLLNPGPVNVSKGVRRALIQPDLCHREEEFGRLLTETRRLLLDVLGTGRHFTAAILTGSGTCALEAAVASSVSARGKLLVIDNGVYGDRIARIAERHRIRHSRVRSAVTEPPDLDALERALRRDRAIEVVAFVHHETSSGMLNPMPEIGRIVKRAGRVLLVDAISSLGAEAMEWGRNGVDIAVGVSGKCLHGFPGLGFVILRHDQIARIQAVAPRSLYLHLADTLAAQEAGSVPFTPAVQVYFAFRQALRELERETLAGRIVRYHRRAMLLRQGFARLGLEPLIDPSLQSNVLTALRLPRGMSYTRLHDALKARGFIIYAGQGVLAQTIFRIAHMGEAPEATWPRLVRTLQEVIKTP